MIADRAYATGVIRTELRRRRITAVIPAKSDQIAARKRRGSHTAKVLERNTMRPRTITTAVCAALALVLTPAVANAAVPDELFEQTATVDAVGVNVESLPEYPAINAIATPDSGPQEVEFSIDAGAYRGPEGERIEVAKAATYTCILSVDNPHWSSGAGSVIAKPRVACKGPTSTVAIRVLGYLGKTSQNSISSLTIVAQSDYTQNVTVTSTTSYGPKQTWYVPKQGSSTKISRGAYFRGSASASPAPPLLPFNIPGSASAFLWVS